MTPEGEQIPRLSEFVVDIPEDLIAQHPLKERDQCRLMVINRQFGTITSTTFGDLNTYLNPGDSLILNDTRVIPARLHGRRLDPEADVEVLLLRQLEGDLWETLVKPARKFRVGHRLHFGPHVYGDIIDQTEVGGRTIQFYCTNGTFAEYVESHGKPPLPPYIHREANAQDREDYQTVFAVHAGAVAAPTAGLHFTRPGLNTLQSENIKLGYVTLHVGLGTFRPVHEEDITRHHMDAEFYHVPVETANLINEVHAENNRAIAVGTTVTRALESVVTADGTIQPGEGWTEKFIYPPYDFRAIDALLTNFHQPQSTLILLVAALVGKDLILQAYRQAVEERYRFFSYGDAMLIL